jgi:effector-binding domain-containing protein
MSTQTLTCEVIDYATQHTIGIRTHCAMQDLPAVIPQLIGKVAPYFAELGKAQTEPPFVAYYNEDADNLDVQIGWITTERLAGKGEIVSGTIGGGKAVSVMYTGAYRNLWEAHDAAHKFIAAKSYRHAHQAYEIYIDDPANVPESQLKTQVVVMIKG